MRIYQLNPDSTRQKTALFFALDAGYRFKLTDEDGIATVTNPGGDTYNESSRVERTIGKANAVLRLPIAINLSHIPPHIAYEIDLAKCPPLCGDNELGLTLCSRTPNIDSDCMMEALEIDIGWNGHPQTVGYMVPDND